MENLESQVLPPSTGATGESPAMTADQHFTLLLLSVMHEEEAVKPWTPQL